MAKFQRLLVVYRLVMFISHELSLHSYLNRVICFCYMFCGVNSDFFSLISEEKEQFRCYRQDIADTMVSFMGNHYMFLGNCQPTPPQSQNFVVKK